MLTLKKISEDEFYLGELDSQGDPAGFGIFKWPSDNIQIGYWLNGLQEGKGFTYFACGEIYAGEFVSGKRNGYGTYFWANNRFGSGIALNDQRYGWGIDTLSDGTILQIFFRNGKANGQTCATYPCGSTVEGPYVDNKPEGVFRF